MRVCVDLCSGLGGFSEAFINDEWVVIRIDVERKFKPTIVADVCHLPLKENLQPDVLLASPPCERFSIAQPKWPKCGIKKAMEIVGACFEAIAFLKPKLWLLENPMGRLRWFLGTPKQTIRYSDYDSKIPVNKKTDFWGNILFPMVKMERIIHTGHFKGGWMRKHSKTEWCYLMSRTPSQRSKIPLGVSHAIYESVENLLGVAEK